MITLTETPTVAWLNWKVSALPYDGTFEDMHVSEATTIGHAHELAHRFSKEYQLVFILKRSEKDPDHFDIVKRVK